MGYTLHWTLRSNFTKAEWSHMKVVTLALIEAAKREGVNVCFESDRANKPPMVNDDMIRFNGVGEDGHETFILSRKRSDEDYGFCKTARKPYNKLVMGVLMAAFTVKNGKRLRFNVDGGEEDQDYRKAREWVRSILPKVDDERGDFELLGQEVNGAIQVGDGHE